MAEEYGHWYTPTGELQTEIGYADRKRVGEKRAVTLRDARKYGWYPSVTTVLTLLARPGLQEWMLQNAIECALRMPNPTVEEVRAEADEYRDWAASQGSKIHLGLSEHFNGRPLEIEPEVDEIVREFWPWYRESGLSLQRAELAVVSPLGYAGTVDYTGTYFGAAAVVDFKTQNFDAPHKALFYDEHALQLAGYDEALGGPSRVRLSVILSREVPGLVAMHNWSEKIGENARWSKAWLTLWKLWQILKNYYPVGEEHYDPDHPET